MKTQKSTDFRVNESAGLVRCNPRRVRHAGMDGWFIPSTAVDPTAEGVLNIPSLEVDMPKPKKKQSANEFNPFSPKTRIVELSPRAKRDIGDFVSHWLDKALKG